MKDKLNEAKEKIGTEGSLIKLFQKFREDLPNLTAKEQIARIGEMLFVATVGKFIGLQKILKKTNKDKHDPKEKEKPKDKKDKDKDKKEAPPPKEEKETELEKLVKIPDPGKRVTMITRKLEKDKNNLNGKHCWDWVDKVYKTAGVTRKDKLNGKDYFNKYEGKNCGTTCANQQELNRMKPGDHIFINNKNSSDVHGNHSVIFLGWKDRDNRLAEIISLPWPGNPPKKETVNLFKKPVTYMTGPVNAT